MAWHVGIAHPATPGVRVAVRYDVNESFQALQLASGDGLAENLLVDGTYSSQLSARAAMIRVSTQSWELPVALTGTIQ